MVLHLERTMVTEIERIGKLRAPNEACGVLLPEPLRGRWVWEMPNRSATPRDSFEILPDDLYIELDGYLPLELDADFLSKLTIWHTHPGGNLGPSAEDLKVKPPYFKSLVVALYDDEPAKASWF